MANYSKRANWRLREVALVLSLAFFGLGASVDGQVLSVTSPEGLAFFRPTVDAGEGNFTSLPFRVSIVGDVGYDDNIYAQHSDRKGSGFSALALDLAGNIGNERTQLQADLSAGFDAYWDRPGRSVDPDITLNLNFTHQFNPRAVLSLSSYMTYQTQPLLSLGIGPVNDVGDYFYTINQLSLGYQWTRRFSTVTSYSLGALLYDNDATSFQEDRLEHTIGQQFRLMVLPTVTAVAEYRFGYEEYLRNSDNDSYSQYILGGADFTLSPKLTFGFRAGVEFRHIDGPFSEDATYPYAESTLIYRYQPNSTLIWYSRYGLEESDISLFDYRKTFRTGLKIVHAFSEKLRATIGIYYAYSDYSGVQPFSESVLDISLGLNFQITRSFNLGIGYLFDRDFSEIDSRDYYRNRFYISGEFTF